MPDDAGRADLDAAFFERFFARLAASGVPTPAGGAGDAEPAVWRVEELPDGRWAVVPEAPDGVDEVDGSDEAGEADAAGAEGAAVRWELDDRRQAYLTAACLTGYAALGPTGTGDELREAAGAGGAGAAAVVARILQGLVASPAAIELVLAAADPEVADEARRLAAERLARGEVN